LAQKTVTKSKALLRTAARQGGWSRMIELVAKHGPPALGSFFYLMVALVGITYSLGYYDRFEDVDILGLFDTPDFLLSAFGNLWALLFGIVAPFVALALLTLVYLTSSTVRANLHARDRRKSLLLQLTIWLPPIAILAPLGFSFLLGKANSLTDVSDPQYVQYATRGAPGNPDARNPNLAHTILLGTTSDFHIFYECAAVNRTDEEGNKTGSVTARDQSANDVDVDCTKDGLAFVVPTANVASVTFQPIGKSTRPPEPTENPIANSLSELHATLKTLVQDVNTETESKRRLTVRLPELESAIADLQESLVDHPPVTIVDTTEILALTSEIKKQIDASLKNNGPVVSDPPNGSMKQSLMGIEEKIDELSLKIESLRGTPARCDERLKMIDVVGPFPEGQSAPDANTRRRINEDIDRATKRLYDRRTPQYLMLVGRVDTKRPQQEGIEYSGSADTLALSRAKWTLDRVKTRASELGRAVDDELFSRAAILSAGLMSVRDDSIGQEDAEERVVEIWVCGTF
ncbi:MAG: hypothetical protein OXP36_08905, partial [Gammaproteobacteria bacterium]|nr:hypothetical protein [Gammaproteobacteria bacterium]